MSSVRAAHVLPIAQDLATGTVYVLLGKERRVHGWADSETWSDFGGRVDDARDSDAEAAAAREYWEETCALVSWGGSAPALRVRYYDPRAALVRSACVFDECDSLARALRDGEYALRLCADDNVTFVKIIPFEAALPHSFDVVWRELHARFFAQVVRPAQRERRAQPLPAYVDDHDVPAVHGTLLVRSVDIDDSVKVRVRRIGATLSRPARVDERSWKSRRSELLQGDVQDVGVAEDSADDDTDGGCRTLSEEQLGELLVEEHAPHTSSSSSSSASSAANASVTVRAAFDDSPLSGSLLARAHPARRARAGVTDGAFLEKKAIAWWPLDSLAHASRRADGILRHDANHLERLRPGFLLRLRDIIPAIELDNR